MRYVEQRRHGGRAVQHATTASRRSTAPIGPYPLTIGRDRVTDETRRDGRPSIPTHPVLVTRRTGSTPPTSTAGCRSAASTSPSSWDERYEPIFRAADPGEQPLAGGAARRAPRQAGATSTPASPSSGSCPPACPAPTGCFANLLAGEPSVSDRRRPATRAEPPPLLGSLAERLSRSSSASSAPWSSLFYALTRWAS